MGRCWCERISHSAPLVWLVVWCGVQDDDEVVPPLTTARLYRQQPDGSIGGKQEAVRGAGRSSRAAAHAPVPVPHLPHSHAAACHVAWRGVGVGLPAGERTSLRGWGGGQGAYAAMCSSARAAPSWPGAQLPRRLHWLRTALMPDWRLMSDADGCAVAARPSPAARHIHL